MAWSDALFVIGLVLIVIAATARRPESRLYAIRRWMLAAAALCLLPTAREMVRGFVDGFKAAGAP
jgi:hypothetical protein